MLRMYPSFLVVIARFCTREIPPHELVENDSHVLPEYYTLCVDTSCTRAWISSQIHMGDDSSSNLGEQCMANIPTMVHDAEYKDCTTKRKRPEDTPSAPRSSWQAGGEHDAPTWKLSGTQGTASFWERAEAPLPPPRPKCNFIHPKQLSPFPERLRLPFSIDEILSGFEDIVSSGTDQFTAWVKTDPDATLVRHMVDVHKTVAEFREVWCILVCHPYLTIIPCCTAVWAQACGLDHKTSFVISHHLWFIRRPTIVFISLSVC